MSAAATPSSMNYARFRQRMVIGMLTIGVLAISAVSWKIYTSWQQRQSAARAQTQNFVNAIEAHVQHTVQFVDVSLYGLANAIKALPRQEQQSSVAIKRLLASSGAGFSKDFWVVFVDADGMGVVTSNNLTVQGVSYADRDYFRAHAGADVSSGLYVGQPAISKVAGRRVFFLSRRVETVDGRFLGVVAAPIDAERIASVFDSARFDSSVSIMLTHKSGRVIARAPRFEQSFAIDISSADFFRRLPVASSGTFQTVSVVDRQPRIYSYRALDGLPLIVTVGIALQGSSSLFGQDLLIGGIGLLLLVSVMLAGGRFALHAYRRLQRSEENYRQLYASIRDGIVLIDVHDRIVECNDAFVEIVGHPSSVLIGASFAPWSPEQWRNLSALPGKRQAAASAALDQYEKECLRGNGDTIWISAKLWPVNYGDSNAMLMVALVRDVTEHRHAQQALRAAHDELETKVHQRTVALVHTNEKLKLEIAERKQVEAELRHSRNVLQQLTAHQQRIKEAERKRIAREIHDDLGQNLLALRIDVSMMHARTARRHNRLHAKTSLVLQNIDATIRSVRSIINNLRPATLELGLEAAIEWQVREFERVSGIACSLVLAADDVHLAQDDESVLTIFRVLQESLTNVARHARASAVSVALAVKDTRLLLTIIDNGVGMDMPAKTAPNGFGLVGMRERVHALGGELLIDATPGQGTRIQAAIPLKDHLGYARQA